MACDGDEQRWAEERAAQLQADEEVRLYSGRYSFNVGTNRD